LRSAIFGGTFDPVHNAHLAVAREAARVSALDRVLFVPAARPPHKFGATFADYEDRFRMVELACAADPRFEPSRLEAGLEQSFSINTIERLRAQMPPGADLFFIIGTDAFAEVSTWRRWRDVVRLVEFIVVSRPGHLYQVPPGARAHRLETLELAVSSSTIRRKLEAGDFDVPVPETVLQYILERGLYGATVAKDAP
jgi:nicotinate-nucleotide adenylyltransferase